MKITRLAVLAVAALLWLVAPVAAGETTTIPKTDLTPALPAYVAHPAGTGHRPAVLVLHGCSGYSKHYAEIADWVAAHGYVAVAIDSLTPRGIKESCGDPAGSRGQAADARAALEWMRAQPYIDGAKLALLGYSMGSIALLDVIDERRLTEAPAGLVAAVAYYPACARRDPQSVRAPLLILDGDADDWIPVAPCQALAKDAVAAGKSVSITTYPGATHAFDWKSPNDRVSYGHHLHYDATAAADAELKTLDFLQKYLGVPPA